MAALTSASPFFWHLVAVAEEVHDWLSCGPGAAAAVVTVVVTVVGAGWDGTDGSAVAIAGAPIAAAAATAAAPAATIAVMCFNPIRMAAPLRFDIRFFFPELICSQTDPFWSAVAAAQGAQIGAASEEALGGPWSHGVGVRKGVVDFNVALPLAFGCPGVQVGAELAIVGRSRRCGADTQRDSAYHQRWYDGSQCDSHGWNSFDSAGPHGVAFQRNAVRGLACCGCFPESRKRRAGQPWPQPVNHAQSSLSPRHGADPLLRGMSSLLDYPCPLS